MLRFVSENDISRILFVFVLVPKFVELVRDGGWVAALLTSLGKFIAMKDKKKGCERIAVLGNFNSTNFGNEITLAVVLHRLRRSRPNAQYVCICNGPEAITVANHRVETRSLFKPLFGSWRPKAAIPRVGVKVVVGLLNDAWHWFSVGRALRSVDVLLIPGTGLLTDAFGLRCSGWGPYYCFKWSLIARLLGCKLFFVSVGAGPIYSSLGRFFTKTALSLAQFRSYRDQATKDYLKSIGFSVENDPVYPDLVFGISEPLLPSSPGNFGDARIVGVGVMEYAGAYSSSDPSAAIERNYLQCLVEFAQGAIANGNDVSILIGDLSDVSTGQTLMASLVGRLGEEEKPHLINELAASIEALLQQIMATEVVVATRFHNIVLAICCNKPVVAISFHPKCKAVMAEVGLLDYCLDINSLTTDALTESFYAAKLNSADIKSLIERKVDTFRLALDEQYEALFGKMSNI
jgi:polysaccharide pyruvyl transferase WcaK-like protein